jgi:ABC-type branched-subunit amino acid transport system substrate-binding protein
VLAACGSSSSSASSPSGSGTSTNTAGSSLKGSPIVFFDLESLNNPIQSEPADSPAENAAAQAINAAGGIDGHPIKIITCNGAGNQNTAEACARTAVSDHVAAVTGMGDPFEALDVPILAAAGIPMIGIADDGDQIVATSPYSWPLIGGGKFDVLASPFFAKELGAKRFADITLDVPPAVENAIQIQQIAPKSGITYVGNVEYPISGVTDYSPYAAKLAQLKPDAIGTIASPDGIAAVINAARQQGLTNEKWMIVAQASGEAINDSEGHAFDNTYYVSSLPVPRDTNIPYVAKYDQEVQAHTGQTIDQNTALYSSHGINAWLAVYAAAKVAESVHGSITSASMQAELKLMPETSIFGFQWNPNGPGVKGFPRHTNAVEYLGYINSQGLLEELNYAPVNMMTILGQQSSS